jgi:hypothetical protein
MLPKTAWAEAAGPHTTSKIESTTRPETNDLRIAFLRALAIWSQLRLAHEQFGDDTELLLDPGE